MGAGGVAMRSFYGAKWGQVGAARPGCCLTEGQPASQTHGNAVELLVGLGVGGHRDRRMAHRPPATV